MSCDKYNFQSSMHFERSKSVFFLCRKIASELQMECKQEVIECSFRSDFHFYNKYASMMALKRVYLYILFMFIQFHHYSHIQFHSFTLIFLFQSFCMFISFAKCKNHMGFFFHSNFVHYVEYFIRGEASKERVCYSYVCSPITHSFTYSLRMMTMMITMCMTLGSMLYNSCTCKVYTHSHIHIRIIVSMALFTRTHTWIDYTQTYTYSNKNKKIKS